MASYLNHFPKFESGSQILSNQVLVGLVWVTSAEPEPGSVAEVTLQIQRGGLSPQECEN